MDRLPAASARDHGSSPESDTRIPLSPTALRVLEKRYLARDDQGRILESPEQLFRRVARAVARADREHAWRGRTDPETTEQVFYEMMASLRFLPNSPTLMNAGRPNRDRQQLCACFVLPVEDSMEGIFETLKRTAVIHQTGGGTGFSFSRLRPRNSRVHSTSGVASGPVSFMKVFNSATEAIKQGGTRRGANMAILRVDHPDILEFIDCKREGSEVANFNISVGITDAFMEAWDAEADYDLIDPRGGRCAGRLSARAVFDRIVESAWLGGDPGLIFLDRINETNPTRHVAEIEATNPCGEQPLSPHEACTLGSIQLSRFVTPGDPGAASIDWSRLREAVHEGIHFLDNVLEVTAYPVPEIEEVTRTHRRVGLGVMGWADLLIDLGIPYDSTEALELADRVMGFIHLEARAASARLAQDRGPFPSFAGSLHDRSGLPPLRNATTTTVAPTGSISILAGASGGIEPLFAVAFARKHILDLADDEEVPEVHPRLQELLSTSGGLAAGAMRRIVAEGSVRGLPDEIAPPEIKRLFATAHDIAAEWHVRMQAAFQRHCDNAVSKTVNMPESATLEDVRTVYLLARQLGCKGITIYRDRSRSRQVLNRRQRRSMRLEELGRSLSYYMADPDRFAPAAPRDGSRACFDCGATIQAGVSCSTCPECGSSRCE